MCWARYDIGCTHYAALSKANRKCRPGIHQLSPHHGELDSPHERGCQVITGHVW